MTKKSKAPKQQPSIADPAVRKRLLKSIARPKRRRVKPLRFQADLFSENRNDQRVEASIAELVKAIKPVCKDAYMTRQVAEAIWDTLSDSTTAGVELVTVDDQKLFISMAKYIIGAVYQFGYADGIWRAMYTMYAPAPDDVEMTEAPVVKRLEKVHEELLALWKLHDYA
jgi:hypothetical protein